MLLRCRCVQSFEAGDYIIRQGEEGTRFYIINEGEASLRACMTSFVSAVLPFGVRVVFRWRDMCGRRVAARHAEIVPYSGFAVLSEVSVVCL